MTPGAVRGLTANAARTFQRGAVGLTVARYACAASLFIPIVVSAIGEPACTVSAPCGTSVPFAWVLALAGLSLVCTVHAPVVQLTSAIGVSAISAAADPAISARPVWAAYGIAAAGVLLTWLALLRRQHRLLAALADDVPVTLAGTPRTPVVRVADGGLISLLAGLAVLSFVLYSRNTQDADAHRHDARTRSAIVTAIDSDASELTLDVGTDPSTTVTAEVAETGDYHVGQEVPVLVDDAARAPWVRLVAEPDDFTGWLAGTIVAAIGAGLAGLRPLLMWRVRRALKTGSARLLTARVEWGETPTLLPSDVDEPVVADLRIRAVAGTLDGHPHSDRLAEEDTVALREGAGTDMEFADFWRSDEPLPPAERRTVAVVGPVYFGAPVVLIADDGAVSVDATIQSAARPVWPWRRKGSRTSEASRDESLAAEFGALVLAEPNEPVREAAMAAFPSRRDRVLGLVFLVLVPVLVLLDVLRVPENAFQAAMLLILGGESLVAGIHRLFARLQWSAAGVLCVGGLRRHRVGWGAIAGVRLSGDVLNIALLDGRVLNSRIGRVTGDETTRSPCDAAQSIELLRQRAAAFDALASRPDVGPGPAAAPLALYAVAALVFWWTQFVA